MIISSVEIELSSLSIADYGRVFWWNDRLFRGYKKEHRQSILDLLESGLIQELISKHLFVNSWISDLSFEGYDLVVEHQVIDVPLYPKEWTFSMLKDAALLILEINEIALQYGYQTADCHAYNVLFCSTRPVYVDMGSFKKIQIKDKVLSSYEDFLRNYYYPLKLWSIGGDSLGARFIPRIGLLTTGEVYLKFRWSIFRCFSDIWLAKIMLYLHAVRTIQHRDTRRLSGRYPILLLMFQWLAKYNILSGPAKIRNLYRVVRNIKPSKSKTLWSDYHNQLNNGSSTPRFDYILQRIASLNINSVLEIAGNQGIFSRMLANQLGIKKVICTDADTNALDNGYRNSRDLNETVYWAVLNPFVSESAVVEIPIDKRLQVDVVVALALTHHLILTQNYRLDHIFLSLSQFAKKFIFIEFMPLGLYNGVSAPQLPEWYSEEWFEFEFVKKFRLIEKTKLEENRILFLGEII